MCHLNDRYGYTLSVDFIDDSIRTFSNPVSVLGALKLARADRMWVGCKTLNRGNDSGHHVSRKLPKFFGGGALPPDLK